MEQDSSPKLRIARLGFDGNDLPVSVDLRHLAFRDVADSTIGGIALTAHLTLDEAAALRRILEEIARRVQAELRAGLE